MDSDRLNGEAVTIRTGNGGQADGWAWCDGIGNRFGVVFVGMRADGTPMPPDGRCRGWADAQFNPAGIVSVERRDGASYAESVRVSVGVRVAHPAAGRVGTVLDMFADGAIARVAWDSSNSGPGEPVTLPDGTPAAGVTDISTASLTVVTS